MLGNGSGFEDEKRRGGSTQPLRLGRPSVGSRRFAILRVSKLSGMGKVAAAARHNLRERDAPNARPEDVNRNIHLAGARTSQELAKLWEKRAPEKVRKNAVHALEYVVTASPEKMQAMGQEDSKRYLCEALIWLQEKHGPENILSAVIHQDETTPHLQVLVIPIDERGKLNARAMVGGKAQLSAMQTDFAERVGAKYELDRGIKRSNARHETIKSYYGRVNDNAEISLTLPGRAIGGFMGRGRETDGEWRTRVSEVASEAVRVVGAQAVEERKALRDELDHTKLALADMTTKAKTAERSLHVVEVAHNVADYEGEDKHFVLSRFHEQYVNRAAKLPDNVRYIVDKIMMGQGMKGFWQIEEEREEAERAAAEREAQEQQRLIDERLREDAEWERKWERDHSRDSGYER